MTGAINQLGEHLCALRWQVATAESCTGGGIAYHLTELAGASDWFAGGVLAYNNAVKQDALGVSAQTLIEHGAVSEPTVVQMARGVFARMHVDCTVAVSGVAGPSGGTTDKPVGTVWLAWAWRDAVGNTLVRTHEVHLSGNRSEIRLQTVALAVKGLNALLLAVRQNRAVPDILVGIDSTRWA